MTVFVPNETTRRGTNGVRVAGRDLTPALAYGALHVLWEGPVPIAPAQVIARLRAALRDFGDDDYILATGAPHLIGWAIAIAADVNRGRVKTLVWDRETRSYLEAAARLR